MRKIEEWVYTFSELTKDAQEKVLDRNFGINVECIDWWDSIYEEFVDCVRAKYNVEVDPRNIFFSGFWNPGDGASFTVDLSDDEIRSLLDKFHITFRLGLKEAFIDLIQYARIERTNIHYSNPGCVSANISLSYDGRDRIDAYLDKKLDEFETALNEWKNRLCMNLYRTLEDAYEDLTSEEAIKESIEDAGLEFYADGTQYLG